MCGRYSLACRPEELGNRTRQMNLTVDQIRSGEQSTLPYNMCPGRYGAVYRKEHGNSDDSDVSSKSSDIIGTLDFFKWGLLPSYSKDQSISYKTFNCRIESLGVKRGLWTPIKQNKRCLIPAEGYFEWEAVDKHTKIPYFVTRKDGHPLFFAGLWDRNDKAGEPVFSYTMITQPACPFMEWLHPRMPLMLDVSDPIVSKWLDPDYKWTTDLMDIAKAAIDHEKLLKIYQVAKDVGNVKNNYPELRDPVSKRKHEDAEDDKAISKKQKKSEGSENRKLTSFFSPIKKETDNGKEDIKNENEKHAFSNDEAETESEQQSERKSPSSKEKNEKFSPIKTEHKLDQAPIGTSNVEENDDLAKNSSNGDEQADGHLKQSSEE